MKVGEVWKYKSDGTVGKITRLWHDELSGDRVAIESFPDHEKEDFAPHYNREEFLKHFEKVS